MVLSQVSREVFQFLAFNGTDRCCVNLVRMFLEFHGTGVEHTGGSRLLLDWRVRSYADGVACGDALKKEHPTPCITPPMEPRPWNIWRPRTLFAPGPKVADCVGYLSPRV